MLPRRSVNSRLRCSRWSVAPPKITSAVGTRRPLRTRLLRETTVPPLFLKSKVFGFHRVTVVASSSDDRSITGRRSSPMRMRLRTPIVSNTETPCSVSNFSAYSSSTRRTFSSVNRMSRKIASVGLTHIRIVGKGFPDCFSTSSVTVTNRSSTSRLTVAAPLTPFPKTWLKWFFSLALMRRPCPFSASSSTRRRMYCSGVSFRAAGAWACGFLLFLLLFCWVLVFTFVPFGLRCLCSQEMNSPKQHFPNILA